MAALTADRDTKRRDGVQFEFPVAASTTIYAGGIVAVNASNYAVPGATSTTLKSVGIAEEYVANGAVAGAVRVKVRRGVYRVANSAAGDAIALADVGALAYIVDDQTVAKTNGSNTRSAAGVIRDVDSDGVWVEF